MALDPTRLSGALRAALLDAGSSGAQDNDALTAMCDAIAAAVITEITTGAVVTVQALGLISPGGVSPAPVTGIAIGTVS